VKRKDLERAAGLAGLKIQGLTAEAPNSGVKLLARNVRTEALDTTLGEEIAAALQEARPEAEPTAQPTLDDLLVVQLGSETILLDRNLLASVELDVAPVRAPGRLRALTADAAPRTQPSPGGIRVIGRLKDVVDPATLRATVETMEQEHLRHDLPAGPFEPGLRVYRSGDPQTLQPGTLEAFTADTDLCADISRPNRVLLVVHGGNSNSRHVLDRFNDRLKRKERPLLDTWPQYRSVIFFTHRSLTEDPEQNAKLLAAELHGFLAVYAEQTGEQAPAIDILCHSRGGLVTRALLELDSLKDVAGDLRRLVRQVCFVASPNGGMNLFHPSSYAKASMALSVAGALSGLDLVNNLALVLKLAADQMDGKDSVAPGVECLHPGSLFLRRLAKEGTKPPEVRYFAVGSNYKPSRQGGFFRRLVAAGLDKVMDKLLIETANDLVVESTSPMGRVEIADSHGAQFGKWLDLKRVLHFGQGESAEQLQAEYGDKLTVVPDRTPAHSSYFAEDAFGEWFRTHFLTDANCSTV
jgi:hypothetical protein